ncbi:MULTISPECIES: alcohol dehydrogenase [Gordonibacter]|uniref:Alcohol dehydrogenase n=1 Tax=Gordonibacter faecis TaxID=3047475 RepID=A0ABT7DSQ4_9ACTN|nr:MULTISPECIES: alcohol dehydrogenase [unclassified Gordonibacter]MDJ1651556.1 alcohol dehydrogenase [Gordonibacter sp. KGMB12511]HIW76980.1 alcohol dehydrogenase [Candidatus Gordonibacter avicola]
MSVTSREKIALLVFAGLIVLSLCGLGWYILAGHSWNVAASNLDDTFGSMEGYTAIVYPGTADPAIAAAAKQDQAEKGSGASATSGSTTAPEAAGLGEEPLGAGAPLDGAQVPDGEKSADQGREADAPKKPVDASGTPATDADAAPSAEPKSTPDASIDTSTDAAKKKKTLNVADAQKSYEDKGATVFALDTKNLSTYEEGVILKKGEHRFGVFSVARPASSIMLEKQIAYFKRHQVDFVVALVDDKERVKDVEGIDIVLSTQDEDLFVMGETVEGTFYVDAPELGSVGAIIISPHNVVSAKVIQEL